MMLDTDGNYILCVLFCKHESKVVYSIIDCCRQTADRRFFFCIFCVNLIPFYILRLMIKGSDIKFIIKKMNEIFSSTRDRLDRYVWFFVLRLILKSNFMSLEFLIHTHYETHHESTLTTDY